MQILSSNSVICNLSVTILVQGQVVISVFISLLQAPKFGRALSQSMLPNKRAPDLSTFAVQGILSSCASQNCHFGYRMQFICCLICLFSMVLILAAAIIHRKQTNKKYKHIKYQISTGVQVAIVSIFFYFFNNILTFFVHFCQRSLLQLALGLRACQFMLYLLWDWKPLTF